MGMTWDDVRMEMAAEAAWAAAVEQRERFLQCIYMFVEGESEVIALPTLLSAAGFDLENNPVLILNMGGAGNAKHAVRILRSTLSGERPIVLVLDRDEQGLTAANDPVIRGDRLTRVFHLPTFEAVKESKISGDGSFEDIFENETLVGACIGTLLPDQRDLIDHESLLKALDNGDSKLKQINRLIRKRILGFREIDKLHLASTLSEVKPVPRAIVELAQVLNELRATYPFLSHVAAVERDVGPV